MEIRASKLRRHRSTPLRWRRRGTILVFVLGILTLLSLVGLVLIARTHGHARSVSHQVSALATRSVSDGIVRNIRERLRTDIWGPSPTSANFPLPTDSGRIALPLDSNHNDIDSPGLPAPQSLENNEPYDAPGPDDRWLASTTPYFDGTWQTFVGAPTGGASDTESDVFVWPHVSYLGGDLLDPAGRQFGLEPYAWAGNRRINPVPATPTPVFYGDDLSQADGLLRDVPILQTPPPQLLSLNAPLIPGSTTNVTIAQARQFWNADWSNPLAVAAFTAATSPGAAPRFPYFDTNADGILDLYDADGDGIPDSPLSMAIPVQTDDPDDSRTLYAAVRIVDHASMLNVNVASSAELPNGAPMFDEVLPGLQRRGRRATELLLDELLHRDDVGPRAANMVAYRNNSQTPDPVRYDSDVVRRALIGGGTGFGLLTFGLADEASLRHRHLLVPYDRREESAFIGFESIDRALSGTLAWNRTVNGSSYDVNPAAGLDARWSRFHSNYQPIGTSGALYEGYDDPLNGNVKGWRSLLREDEPYFVRRHLLTTVSHEVAVGPEITDRANPLMDTLDERMADLRFRGMDWPVLNYPRFPGLGLTLSGAMANLPNVPDSMRVQPVDLNMSARNFNSAAAAKEDFVRYAAGAMYVALEGVEGYQGIPLFDDALTAEDERLNREWLAWQFAVNLADYRDADNIPTGYGWDTRGPAGVINVIGVEKQPFFTEAYAHLIAGNNPGSGTGPSANSGPPGGNDQWFFAVEVYVPPFWQIPIGNLALRAPNINTWPLSSFTRIPGGQTPILDGGTQGSYVVFTGATSAAPSSVQLEFNDPSKAFYRNNGFRIATDGTGSVELVYDDPATSGEEHTLDVIGPEQTGSPLGVDPLPIPGFASWAQNPGLPPGRTRTFSLLRSTQGWRFTTAWQVHSQNLLATSGGPPFQPSLGDPNEPSVGAAATQQLTDRIPELIWPTRTALNGNAPPNTFGTRKAEDQDIDSVADLGRMWMVGPVSRTNPLAPPFLTDRNNSAFGAVGLPVTQWLAETAGRVPNGNLSDDLDGTASQDRLAVGHPDFVRAARVGTDVGVWPWTWRLFQYFSARTPLFDAIDNDGDGLFDLVDDPTEGVTTLNRVAGRININTAPVSVLRTVPFTSLLPTSSEYVALNGLGDPAADFVNIANTGRFWDLASAIVAAREHRSVPIRLPDGLGVMQTVAQATRSTTGGRFTPAVNHAYTQFAELSILRNVFDASPVQNDALFRVDRHTVNPNDPNLALVGHRLIGADPTGLGPDWEFSPDFRYQRVDNDDDGQFSLPQGDDFVADYVPVLRSGASLTSFETLGLRARDIFLSRWANLLTVRSDVFTAYIALIDENGDYVQRTQVTLDRSDCFRDAPGAVGTRAILPRILTRSGGSYEEVIR